MNYKQCQFTHLLQQLRLNVNKKFQLDATVCRHLFTAKSLYMFRLSHHPSSGALKTVTATSGIGHNTGTATSFRGLIGTAVNKCLHTVASSWTFLLTFLVSSLYKLHFSISYWEYCDLYSLEGSYQRRRRAGSSIILVTDSDSFPLKPRFTLTRLRQVKMLELILKL